MACDSCGSLEDRYRRVAVGRCRAVKGRVTDLTPVARPWRWLPLKLPRSRPSSRYSGWAGWWADVRPNGLPQAAHQWRLAACKRA